MSERFGIPDHSPQHAPDHSLQNPTAQGNWNNIGGGGDGAWPATPTYGGGGGGGGTYVPMPYIDTPHRTTMAVVLAMLFGPLGLFYVGILQGMIALFTVIPLTERITRIIAPTFGGDSNLAWTALVVMWCITVPWAIAGVRWRNRRFNTG
jgi:hypothetical protein